MDLTFQVPMQCCSLQHWTLLSPPDMSTTGHCFHFGSAKIASFLLELFLCSSPGVYWRPSDLGCSSSSITHFAFSYCSWGSQGKNAEVACHSLLRGTTFCQDLPPWPSYLRWRCMAWLTVSLSSTKLWSMWSFWLVFCDCGFHSVFLLMDEDKRLVEASWCERLAVGKIGSYSGGQSHAQ